MNSYEVGMSDTRPWGSWSVESVGNGYVVKKITVNPKGKLSLQKHQHRSEHWIIVAGEAEVTLGETTEKRSVNDVVFIGQNVTHRISNCGTVPLEFVEIQTGETLDENDIQRLEDVYGRS